MPIHRVPALAGQVAAAARCDPAEIEGDGWRTVRALVEHTNATRLQAGLAPIPIDNALDVVVARQGLALDAVPPQGMRVVLCAPMPMTTAGA